jgi:hypothetical protein
MDVKACDNCKKLNTETDKPFALVGGQVDINDGAMRNVTAKELRMIGVFISPQVNWGRNGSTKAKTLCNDCTMPYATELVVELFSTENMSKP